MQYSACGMGLTQIEQSADLALILAAAHQIRAATPAQNKPKTVKQNGFTSARFTC